jgi:two-component system, OmpR family, sensor kinase
VKFFHSIRWRLQLWHGLLLACVLTCFGYTAWRLARATQYQRVDQELEERLAAIAGATRRAIDAAGRLPRDRPLPAEGRGFDERLRRHPELRLNERETLLFNGGSGSRFYFVVWLPDGRELTRSSSALSDALLPPAAAGSSGSRERGSLRERFHFTPPGECILVGCDIRDDRTRLRRFAWLLVSAGGIVMALGMAGGWWISLRVLSPISAISATAAKISTGDLSQRIGTISAGSELDHLVHVLNGTFARLQASFARQAQFTADASHELRTPVSVVLTQTQTALARERPAAEYRESLAACQRAAQRMRRLTESLLTLARLDSGEDAAAREPCDLERITKEAVDLLRPLAQEQEVTLSLELAAVRCEGNAEQLGQIVTNLVSNAIYYNRPGGTVQIRTAAEADGAVLSVTDTGQGISPEDLPHICERFYRANKARSNVAGRTGLGLAITKAIVETHNGSLQMASELGRGSTVAVRLPVGRVREERRTSMSTDSSVL